MSPTVCVEELLVTFGELGFVSCVFLMTVFKAGSTANAVKPDASHAALLNRFVGTMFWCSG